MRVALIEFGGGHDECLYAQASALRSIGVEVHLFASSVVADRMRAHGVFHEIDTANIRKGLDGYRQLYALNDRLAANAYDRIVFNTASGGAVKRMCSLPNYPGIMSAGILHNVAKLSGSWGQKLISRRLSLYFVLADYLATTTSSTPLVAYYPFEQATDVQSHTRRGLNSSKLHLCVPGQVSLARRDYRGLFHALAEVSADVDYSVTLLGRADHAHGDGEDLRSHLKTLGLQNRVQIWSDFISPNEFSEVLAKAEYVLPLIHPDHKSFNLYKSQITGAFNLAFANRITLLLHEFWSRYAEFLDTSLFYKDLQGLTHLIETLYGVRSYAPYSLDKWSAEQQHTVYLQALALTS